MQTIFANGVFDLLHDGHKQFLDACRRVSKDTYLIVAINSDESARALKAAKWGPNYPRDRQHIRAMNLTYYADQVLIFNTESELHDIIEFAMPCVICKGPDYAGKRVTGDDLAPVIILDTHEPESAKLLKRQVYGQQATRSQGDRPNSGGSTGILSAEQLVESTQPSKIDKPCAPFGYDCLAKQQISQLL